MPVTRRWNLNEAEGRYAKTNLKDQILDLHLGLKRVDGTKAPVGLFRLDLPRLAADGCVTVRNVRGSIVYDVQIYREPNGAYLLGVRCDQVTRLDRFAVR